VGGRENGKKRKKVGEEIHKTVIFHHHVEAPFRNRFTPNLMSLYFVDLAEVITLANFDFKIFIGFSRPIGGKNYFPFESKRIYNLYNSATQLYLVVMIIVQIID